MDFVEKAAQAMFYSEFDRDSYSWDQSNDHERRCYREMAAAAIEAIGEWQPIETAPKDRVFIGGSWEAEQGGPDWKFFMSYWATDHFAGYPQFWAPGELLPQAPPCPWR